MVSVLRIAGPRLQPLAVLGKSVQDVLEKDEADDDVLALGRIHVAAHLIGHGPQGFFEAERCTVEWELGHARSVYRSGKTEPAGRTETARGRFTASASRARSGCEAF
jgi:hypothetical protein